MVRSIHHGGKLAPPFLQCVYREADDGELREKNDNCAGVYAAVPEA